MSNVRVESCIEAICGKGCRQVRNDIQALERGEPLQEVKQLSQDEKDEVLHQLKAVMAVYGEQCRI